MPRCSIDHCKQRLKDSPLAAPAHARKHKNRFRELVGRAPEDYDEVRALLNRGEWPDDVDLGGHVQPTLKQSVEGCHV